MSGPETHECTLIESRPEFDQHWHCAPPDEGVRYRVLRDEWVYPEGAKAVRHVYEFGPA